MRKAKSQDFWEISRHKYLKKETKEYVPMFLAAVAIAQDPQKYGFQVVEFPGPFNYDKVKVPASTHLKRIANAAEMDLSELRALNPSLRRDKTPPDSALFEINLPPGKKEVFEKNFRTQAALKSAKTHRVRPGENLSRIAKKYRVSLRNLCSLNGLSHNAIVRPRPCSSAPTFLRCLMLLLIISFGK